MSNKEIEELEKKIEEAVTDLELKADELLTSAYKAGLEFQLSVLKVLKGKKNEK